jgi:hypothetical protein
MDTYGNLFATDSDGLDLLSAPDDMIINNPRVYTITRPVVGRPWVIAQLEYNDFRLWWAIAKANKFRVPMLLRDTFRIRKNNLETDNIITDFYQGRMIILPSIEDINAYVLRVQRGR